MRHDKTYKSTFSHRVSVQHLLRFVAGVIDDGPEWLAAFDPEILEPVPIERIDETLHRHLSDLVWRVRLREDGNENWADLFVLIKFQSSVDGGGERRGAGCAAGPPRRACGGGARSMRARPT